MDWVQKQLIPLAAGIASTLYGVFPFYSDQIVVPWLRR
jgi:hypothetical protein